MHPRTPLPLSRRRFIGQTMGLAAALGCGDLSTPDLTGDPRLRTTPGTPKGSVIPGETPLALDAPRDGRLYVPPNYNPAIPAPFILGFHGAGGTGSSWIHAMQPVADSMGIVLLAPDSRDRTWDAITGTFDQDVKFIDRALASVYDRVNVDASRIAMAGFSDGATYSLSLGLANGDLFPSIIAYSPGFVVEAPVHGHPRFFIGHGTADTVLPIDQCSRRIVPALKADGYDVTYAEFDGGHYITTEERDNSVLWMLSRPAAASRATSAWR